MPSLLEILDDPNYTEANQATKEAIFNRYAPLDENYASANAATQQAIKQRFGVSVAPVEAQQKPAEPVEERGALGYLGDVGAAFGAGAGQAVAFLPQLLRLATKETEAGPIEQLGTRATEYWEEKKSAAQRAKEKAVEGKVKAAEEAGAGVLGQAGVAFGEVITDPALLSTYIAQSLPQVVGGGVVGIGAKGATKLGARKLVAEASKESIEKAATKVGVSASVATAALMQGTDVGADTFDEAVKILKEQGLSEEEAKTQAIELGKKAATNATLASLAAQMLPGGRTIESALVRGGMGKGVISGAVKGALRETPSEGLEEGSGAFFKNLALSEIDPARKLSQDVGLQTGIGAAVGTGQGAITGGLGGMGERGQTQAPPVPKTKEELDKMSPEDRAIFEMDTEGARDEQRVEDNADVPRRGVVSAEDVDTEGPPPDARVLTETGQAGLDVPPSVTGGAAKGEAAQQPTLTQEQIDNLAGAGFTATEIEGAVETVRYIHDKRAEFADVLFTPIARDHAAGLTSEEIAKKNKIDAHFARALQIGLGLVPNETAKVAEAPAAETPAVETSAATETSATETPAAETPAVETSAATEPSATETPAESVADLINKYTEYESKEGAGRERFAVYQKLLGRTTDELFSELQKLQKQALSLLTKAGNPPARNSKKAKLYSEINHKIETLTSIWGAVDSEERRAKREAEEAQTAVEDLAAETPAVETSAATETSATETPAPTEPITISKREPVEAPKGVLRSQYTFSDGSTYQIEKRGEEFHLVGVPDENESYLGETRGEAELALNDDKNSGRLDQVVSKGKPGALQGQKPTAFDLQSIEPSPSLGGVSAETTQRTPSLKRIVDRLRKLWQVGKITGDEFAEQVNIAANSIENIKVGKPLKKRVRGADYIRERLLKAKREGVLSSEAVALAEWFISQNEALVDDLAISIEQPPKRGESDVSGDYNASTRLMRLIKGAASDTTAVHEILHHLERMMPENIRSGIRREHARQTYNAYKKAKADGDANLVRFFEYVLNFNFGDPAGIGGVESSLRAAIKLIKDDTVPYSFYQYVNPSEFWAVNGTGIVEGKYAAIRGTTLTRLRNWLRNLAQKIKSAFGFSSDAPILRALDSLSKADGKFITENMLFEETDAPPGRGILQSQEQNSIDVDGETRPLLNSRGQRIHPTDEGVRNFWRGFGDSKVVDEEGRPLAMYTGTSKDKDFSSFSVPKNGAWFTTDPKEASQYAAQNDSMDFIYTEGKYRPVNIASRVIPAYLIIRNPYKMAKKDFDKINKVGYKRAQGQFFDMLRSRGYDGVDMGGGVWVVLKSPTQVKSAVGNTGAFSPTEKKILAAQEQGPTIEGLHPTVSQALMAGDLAGVLKAIANTTSGIYRELAVRIGELGLPTVISTGRARARQLTRAAIDKNTAPQQNRLFTYVQLTYPEIYEKYFKNYDSEANLEQVYEGLKVLKGKDTNPVIAEFEQVLKAYKDSIEGVSPRSLGIYFPDFDEVVIITDREGGTSNRVILHEIVHAATEMLLTKYENDPSSLTEEQRSAAKNVNSLFKYTKENWAGDPNEYGLRNVYEFVAETFSNKNFQDALKKLEYKPANVSVFSRFVKAILRMFGYDTVGANVMIEANKLFSAERDGGRTPSPPLFAKEKQNRNIDDFRTAYEDNDSAIKLIGKAIKGRISWETAVKRVGKDLISPSAYGRRLRQIFLPNMPLRYLADFVKNKIPQLMGAVRLVEQMVSYRGSIMKSAENIVNEWVDFQRNDKKGKQSKLLNRTMIQATLLSEDPDKGVTSSKALNNAWSTLNDDAKNIYRQVRDFYARSVQNMIKELKDRASLIPNEAKRKKALDAIDREFGPAKLKGPYFPLRRFGEFWFQVGTTNADKEFYTFESISDRDYFMEQRMAEPDMLKTLKNGTSEKSDFAKTLKIGNSIGDIYDRSRNPTQILETVEKMVGALEDTTPTARAKEDLRDGLNQLMYVLLPQTSMKKMFINRRGIQGASSDMLRVFADSAVHSAYQQARLKYSQDFLNNLDTAKDRLNEAGKKGLITSKQRAVYDEYIAEVGKRSGTILSAEDKRYLAKVAAAANEISFFWLLSAPATAMLNILGFAQLTVPEMGAEFGYGKTSKLLAKNLGLYLASTATRTLVPTAKGDFVHVNFPSMVEGKRLSPLQEKFAKAFIDAGDINISLLNSLFEFTERPSALYTGTANTVKKFASGLFHQAERLNRELALMTSAELAYEKYLNEPKKDSRGVIQRDANDNPIMRTQEEAFNDALAKARDIAGFTLGDFSRAMKPRTMSTPAGSVLLSMKSYAITALLMLFKNAYTGLAKPFSKAEIEQFREVLKSEKQTDEEIARKIKEAEAELAKSYKDARKKLAGVMGVTFLLGGIQAQPFFTLVFGPLLAIASTLGWKGDDDDDELMDTSFKFNNFMQESVGGFVGDVLTKLGVEDAQKAGKKISKAVAKGIPAAAGAALTERVSLDPVNLLYRAGRFSTDLRESVIETAIANLGPATGLMFNFVDAYKLMDEGQYQRAFERLLPAIVSKPITAARLAEKGATTRSGKPQIDAPRTGIDPEKEFIYTEIAMQAMGIQPEKLRVAQEVAMEATKAEQKIQALRTAILSRLWLERDNPEGYEDAMKTMDKFNNKYPQVAIDADTIYESFARRAENAAMARELGGATISNEVLRERIRRNFAKQLD